MAVAPTLTRPSTRKAGAKRHWFIDPVGVGDRLGPYRSIERAGRAFQLLQLSTERWRITSGPVPQDQQGKAS